MFNVEVQTRQGGSFFHELDELPLTLELQELELPQP